MIIDESGIYRCSGRLKYTPFPYNSRYPVLLPAEHPVTQFIVKKCHDKVMHNCVQDTLSFVRNIMCVKEDKLSRDLSINVSYAESWKQHHLQHHQLQTYLSFVCLIILPSPVVVWISVGLCLSKIYFQRTLQCTRFGLCYLHVHLLVQCT